MTPEEQNQALCQRPGIVALRAMLEKMSPAARKVAARLTAGRLQRMIEQRKCIQSLPALPTSIDTGKETMGRS